MDGLIGGREHGERDGGSFLGMLVWLVDACMHGLN